MSLEFGRHHSVFASEAERRAAWERHRERLLARWRPGKRPAAWWDYDAPIPYPPDADDETSVLYEHGLLNDEEIATLMLRWREDYEHAHEPGFQYCIGHARPGDTFSTWIKGTAAKRAHYRWAGIPRELVERWDAERALASKAIPHP